MHPNPYLWYLVIVPKRPRDTAGDSVDPPSEETPPGPLADLRAQVMALAYDGVRSYFHEDSRTHIYFNNEMGTLGVKGVGDFPDEAFSAFGGELTGLVSEAPEAQLRSWEQQLVFGKSKRRTEQELDRLRRVVSGQISLHLPPNFRRLIDDHARFRRLRVAQYCRDALATQLDLLEGEARSGSIQAVRDQLERSPAEITGLDFSSRGRKQLKFSLDLYLHARLLLFASEVETKPARLYQNLLALDVAETSTPDRESAGGARDAGQQERA